MYDYNRVPNAARIAIYDDMRAAPKVVNIEPAPTNEFIEALASTIDSEAKRMGGKIPYTVVREVAENFIHAQFNEAVVSILDRGNTIRFCDQGPGISDKEKVQLPGFTSAIQPMKQFIRGVGSGFPLVKEYLELSNGRIIIEDNIKSGAVVTISLATEEPEPVKTIEPEPVREHVPVPPLNEREVSALLIFSTEGALGVKELAELCGLPQSSTYNLMKKLTEIGLIEMTGSKKRILTDYGSAVSKQLHG